MNRPEFLSHVRMTEETVSQNRVILRNWIAAHPVVQHASKEKLEEFLVTELEDRRRTHMIDRIHGRYCELRKATERAQLIFGED